MTLINALTPLFTGLAKRMSCNTSTLQYFFFKEAIETQNSSLDHYESEYLSVESSIIKTEIQEVKTLRFQTFLNNLNAFCQHYISKIQVRH